MEYSTILYDKDERLARITLNRPERHNAFSRQLIGEFVDAVRRADEDADIRVLIVAGAGGRAFSAGYDIKESADEERQLGVEGWRRVLHHGMRFTYAAWECSKPVIAMIRGFCLAGGLELAQMCDLRIASTDSKFGAVETRFSTGIATLIMPWIIGSARARELIYTGDTIDAQEAYRIGLINRMYPPDQLEAETLRFARRMSMVALACLQWNKRAVNRTLEAMGLHAAMEYGLAASIMMDSTETPEYVRFDEIRQEQGLKKALEWRDSLFRTYE